MSTSVVGFCALLASGSAGCCGGGGGTCAAVVGRSCRIVTLHAWSPLKLGSRRRRCHRRHGSGAIPPPPSPPPFPCLPLVMSLLVSATPTLVAYRQPFQTDSRPFQADSAGGLVAIARAPCAERESGWVWLRGSGADGQGLSQAAYGICMVPLDWPVSGGGPCMVKPGAAGRSDAGRVANTGGASGGGGGVAAGEPRRAGWVRRPTLWRRNWQHSVAGMRPADGQ